MVSIVIRCCPGEVRGRRQRGGGAPPRGSESGVPAVEWGCAVRASRSTTGDVAGRAGEAADPGGGDLAGGQRRALGMDTVAGGIRVGRGSRSCVTDYLMLARPTATAPRDQEAMSKPPEPEHAVRRGTPIRVDLPHSGNAGSISPSRWVTRGRSRLSVKRSWCAIALQPVERGLK